MTATQQGFSLSDDLRQHYQTLYENAQIRSEKAQEVSNVADKILASRDRYEQISAVCKVPWPIIAVIHWMEAGGNFGCHLHNGDPLGARTVHVPKNRPLGTPPFGFEESALDALDYDGFTGLDWEAFSMPDVLYLLERYNGLGYRRYHPGVNTPYLWSYTNQYTKGKYGADGKFNPELVSKQVGAAALFLAFEARGEVILPSPLRRAPAALTIDESARTIPPSYPGRTIQLNDPNREAVQLIQKRLVELGIAPIKPDGRFGAKTFAAVQAFQARSVDKQGQPLRVDGKVGPMTWEALFGDESVDVVVSTEQLDPLLSSVLDIAQTQLYVREDPNADNRGKDVEAYLASVDMPPGEAWSAAFVYWCFEQAAKKLDLENPVPKTGLGLKLWRDAHDAGAKHVDAAQATDDPRLIMPGHVFVMGFSEEMAHVGLVERVEGGCIATIEGNIRADAYGGDGVYRRAQRKISDINLGFLDFSGTHPISSEEPEGVGGVYTVENPPPPVAPFVGTNDSGGLMLKAVQQGIFEAPQWISLPFRGLMVQVGAHALRATVGDRLLRLPISYNEMIEICKHLGWVPPTVELSDAIWKASAIKLDPVGLVKTKADSDRMKQLEFIARHNANIDPHIPASRWGELAADEGKEWILSRRNLLRAKWGNGPGAANYGWRTKAGKPAQDHYPDSFKPPHDVYHYDYSQILRPIHRKAKRIANGMEVDLLDVIEQMGIPAVLLNPLR